MNMPDKNFYILTGGTHIHVAPHFSLSAPAFGDVGKTLAPLLRMAFFDDGQIDPVVHLVQTRMALGGSERSTQSQELVRAAGLTDLVTNSDVAQFVKYLTTLEDTRGIVMAAALTDFEPESIEVHGGKIGFGFGKDQPRLSSKDWHTLILRPTPKIVPTIRKERKDIFVAAFKTTTGADREGMFLKGLNLLKGSSVNLVLVNDLTTRQNMVLTPEEAIYHATTDRVEALRGLAEMIAMRSKGTFTRSELVPGDAIRWGSPSIPASLRAVVDYCISRGAYKPFKGVTVGHFATRGESDGEIFTSRRRSNFNELRSTGLIRVTATGDDTVLAFGGKPSVGGQSQRAIFRDHPDVDCIVHFHCPLKTGSKIPVRSQRPYECGSHECGHNTSIGLERFGNLKAVMLDNHGPNIVFPKNIDPAIVIDFIESNVELTASTNGVLKAER